VTSKNEKSDKSPLFAVPPVDSKSFQGDSLSTISLFESQISRVVWVGSGERGEELQEAGQKDEREDKPAVRWC
jgi:hypothetical protein